jgi:hypothetical protein
MAKGNNPRRRQKARGSEAINDPSYEIGDVAVHTYRGVARTYGMPIIPADVAGLFESLVPKRRQRKGKAGVQ